MINEFTVVITWGARKEVILDSDQGARALRHFNTDTLCINSFILKLYIFTLYTSNVEKVQFYCQLTSKV